jgi:hypothetical protein
VKMISIAIKKTSVVVISEQPKGIVNLKAVNAC